MKESERDRPDPGDPVEVEDPGESLDAVLEEEEREKAEAYRAALTGFLKDFLPIADSFDRALAHAPEEALRNDFGKGIALIDRQIAELWKKYGVTEVDTSGSFDPNVHEAVATQEVPGAPRDAIVDVLRKGYRINDKLLRPASVKVATQVTAEGRKPETEDRKPK